MKNNYRFTLSLLVFLAFGYFATAQTSLGSSRTFMNNLKKELVNSPTAKGAEKIENGAEKAKEDLQKK